MFRPPRCPNRHCSEHRSPRPEFFVRKGTYHPHCRAQPVPRFRCRTCMKGFSRQTFRSDYRDHRPDLNTPLYLALASGIGLRQSARNLGLSLRCLELKARKLARHLRRLNLNLRSALPPGATLHFDELETFEERRNTRPLSVPVLIESKSRFLIWAESAPIRPHGRMSPARRKALEEDEKRLGKRRNLSRRSIERTLRRGADLAGSLERVLLHTDEKKSYPALARRVFGANRLQHERTNSRLARGTWNPLFAINHTEAMLRDLTGRLRRESWLVSKKRRYLDLALHVWMSYRNYVRRRFNTDKASSAEHLGFLPRRLRPQELLSWRQDWRRESPHPLGDGEKTIAGWPGMKPAA